MEITLRNMVHRRKSLLPIIFGSFYGITRGSYNAEFGCVEMEPPAGKPEVFVIGGNGSGIPVYRKLQRQGIPFVTGVLHTNDADYQVAKELAAKVITEKPFECISESAFEEALEFMGKCEKVYCPLKDFGIMNEKNRELLKKAKETGKIKPDQISSLGK